MITRKQLHNRLQPAIKAGVPVTNYGMAIAYVQGIYNRAIAPFVKGEKTGCLSVISFYILFQITEYPVQVSASIMDQFLRT